MRLYVLGCFLAFTVLVLPAGTSGQEKKSDNKPDVASPNQNTVAEPRLSGQENEQSAQGTNDAQTKTEEGPPFWKDPAASNWALVFVGLLAAIVAVWTLRIIARQTTATERAALAADETLKAAKETAERQLRAYVFPMDGRIHMAQNGQNSIQIVIKNSGQTVAFNCTSCMGAGVFAFPIPENLPTVTAEMGKSDFFLAPGAKTELGGELRYITPIEAVDIQGGTKGIYAVGAIRYTDAFRLPRFVNFRMVCTEHNFSTGRFQFCPEGNQAN
jgi:hypothetical protein